MSKTSALFAIVILSCIMMVMAENVTQSKKSPQELAPLKIDLPIPKFTGTPKDIRIERLEKLPNSARPPFFAPKGTRNVSFGKPVTSSDEEPVIGDIEMITDGDKEAAEGSFVELGPSIQYITIDLKSEYDIYAIVIWHYHQQPRVYKDVVVQVANDIDFTTSVKTLFNNDSDNSVGLGVGTDWHYVENYQGKLIDAKGTTARYVRCYSNGNTTNDLNHYTEVEVYGKPVK